MNFLFKTSILVLTLTAVTCQFEQGDSTIEKCRLLPTATTDFCDTVQFCLRVPTDGTFQYVFMNSTCKVCKIYSFIDAYAVLLHTDPLTRRTWECPNLQEGSVANQIPECKTFAEIEPRVPCNDKQLYTRICAVLNGFDVESDSICTFCTLYGNTTAKITRICT